MKIHFGEILYFETSYYSKTYECDGPLCNNDIKMTATNITEDWDKVTCKNCLRLKKDYAIKKKKEEKNILKDAQELLESFLI